MASHIELIATKLSKYSVVTTRLKRAIRAITIYKYNAHTVKYNLPLAKLYYKIQRKPVKDLFNHVIPTLTHHYNTRQDTLQQYRTVLTFADHTYLHTLIALINKQPIIRQKRTTIKPYSSYVQFVKHIIPVGYKVMSVQLPTAMFVPMSSCGVAVIYMCYWVIQCRKLLKRYCNPNT